MVNGEVGGDVVGLIGDSRFDVEGDVEAPWMPRQDERTTDAKCSSALPVKPTVLANSVIVRSY